MFGMVTDEQFKSQLEGLKIETKIVRIERGRGNRVEVPMPIRKIIAEESIAGTSHKHLSELFGISESSVSAYKHDATSTTTYNQPNKELKRNNDEFRNEITDLARARLRQSLETITPEKLSETKVRDAAGIAKDMSTVIKNITPDGPIIQNTKVLVYQPRMKEEDDFEIITVNE